jgi:hypothetical protein
MITGDSDPDVDRGSSFVRGILYNAHDTCSVDTDNLQRVVVYSREEKVAAGLMITTVRSSLFYSRVIT